MFKNNESQTILYYNKHTLIHDKIRYDYQTEQSLSSPWVCSLQQPNKTESLSGHPLRFSVPALYESNNSYKNDEKHYNAQLAEVWHTRYKCHIKVLLENIYTTHNMDTGIYTVHP